MKSLIIRADAGPAIGTGHVMRCLALAEAWQDTGGDVFFVSSCNSPALEVRLKNEEIRILHISQESGTISDADETARIAHTLGADWIVADGYNFGAEYQKTIKDSGLSLLLIDDYGHADHYFADIVLNQNIYADISFYPKYEPYTRFLLGTKYALIRKEFLKWSGWHRNIPEVALKILVTLGGSDPDNVTLKVIEAVKAVDVSGLEVIVVIGGANPHFDLIHETMKDHPNFTLLKNAENMPELMAWADIAISGGGSTCWELVFMGLPFCIIALAENQLINSERLSENKVAEYLGWFDNIKHVELTVRINDILHNQKIRDTMYHDARLLVAGRGAQLIIQQMIV